jgi:hypothetical protein
MMKPKRKRITAPVKVPLPTANDGTNKPVPDHKKAIELSAEEASLYKQAENPLGDPHKS